MNCSMGDNTEQGITLSLYLLEKLQAISLCVENFPCVQCGCKYLNLFEIDILQ